MDNAILKKLQRYELEILLEVDRICKKHNITYFLICGTLLGAIRHHGFIPWDDDIDIAMPREEYKHFTNICTSEFDKRFFFDSNETNDNYFLSMSKVKMTNTVFIEHSHQNTSNKNCIYIDIFPLDNASKQKSLIQKIQGNLVASIGAARCAKVGAYDYRKFSFINKMAYIFFRNFSLKQLGRWQDFLCQMNCDNSSEYFVNFATCYGFECETIKKSVYLPSKEIEFEGHFFPGLNDNSFYLKRIYGDTYMELPPEEKRITHNPIAVCFNNTN